MASNTSAARLPAFENTLAPVSAHDSGFAMVSTTTGCDCTPEMSIITPVSAIFAMPSDARMNRMRTGSGQ